MQAKSPGAGRQRLERSREEALAPWVPAATLEGCFLYWLPVSAFPMRQADRVWLLEFQRRFSKRLAEEHGLRPELFLQFKTASTVASDSFKAYAMKCKTLLGLSRRPGASLPRFPSAEEIKEATKEGEPPDVSKWVADYCHWFRNKREDEQRELFFGLGGMTTIFLAPDPETIPPKLPLTPALRNALPALKVFDIDAAIQGAFALQDSFLPKSKELFGDGLRDKPEFAGVMYILPLLSSGHFFSVAPEVRSAWFQLFDVYLNESVEDAGMVLAFEKSFEPLLLEILDSMRNDSLLYGEDSKRRTSGKGEVPSA